MNPAAAPGGLVRSRVRVTGVVQGVGFRPFAYALAQRLGLSGWVGNDARGVVAEVEGRATAVEDFLSALRSQAPPLAVVREVLATSVGVEGGSGFCIVDSDPSGQVQATVPADFATCDACLAEMWSAQDRRYRYPFVNCTNCGPRFTIVTGVPYDRPRTTMANFPMCEACRAEYQDPGDRRFHAQPICCPLCGPTLRLSGPGPDLVGEEALVRTAQLLADGEVVAVKGLGGYHLAVAADDQVAVAALRQSKHRYDKPFALMVADLSAARQLCLLNPADEALLSDRRRPIVLCQRRHRAPVAEAVAPGTRQLGLMLPYTGLHHLLVAKLGRPFVLTSGNLSDEPIAYQDDDARQRLASLAGWSLWHDRAVQTRTDDSVVRSFRGAPLVLRRSRGYVPQLLPLPISAPRPVLGCGAEVKNTFCLGRGENAQLSHHIGDLENFETYSAFIEGLRHFCRLSDLVPEVLAYDLHPEYLSTKYALAQEGIDLVGVQHHHAHIASCLADNGRIGPVLGVAFDGLGYGDDGTLWGGELLLADLTSSRRLAHLAPVAMPGGAAAVKEPWRMAAAYYATTSDAHGLGRPGRAGRPPEPGGTALAALAARHADRWAQVTALARKRAHSPLTTSAGRLFDAVAAVLGVRDSVNYEGQAAVELEQLARTGESSSYRVDLGHWPRDQAPGPVVLPSMALWHQVVAEVGTGVTRSTVAARFHNGLADMVADAADRLCRQHRLATVALSGGVFQNVLFLGRLVKDLEALGLEVLCHRDVPPNDGGLSLGQVAIVAALDATVRA